YDEVSAATARIETEKSFGSGFFADNNGHVVTAAHVVLNSHEVSVQGIDGYKYRARIEKLDDIHDLAVLKVDEKVDPKQAYVQFGPSASIKENDAVYALGHPWGLPDLYISPGQVRKLENESDAFSELGVTNLSKDQKTSNPKDSADLKLELDRPM